MRPHAVQGLVLGVALLTHVPLLPAPVLGVHVVPDVGQLVTGVVALAAVVASVTLCEGLERTGSGFVRPETELVPGPGGSSGRSSCVTPGLSRGCCRSRT